MGTVVALKLGERAGMKRIWIEGNKLARMGYVPGMTYDSRAINGGLVLQPAENGKYVVSPRNSKRGVMPLICISREELNVLFAGVTQITVTIEKNKITIEPHHSEAVQMDRVERLRSKIASGEPLDVASLFHGGGVLDCAIHDGLAAAGISSRLALAVEIESKYLECSLANNVRLWDEESLAINSPIQDVNIRTIKTKADIVVAGIPCNGASKSGRSKNHLQFAESHSESGALFFSTLAFIEALNPAIVIIENVTEYANTASMVVIRSVLTGWGYDVQERTLAGAEFGSLENRKRLCVVAICKRVASTFEINNVKTLLEKPDCIADILDNVSLDSPRWKAFEYLAAKEARDISAGKGFRRNILNGTEATCGTIGKFYNKCRSTEPFLQHPTDPSLSRLFTISEHARLKTIEPSLVANESETVAHEIMGQSVNKAAFEAVAFSLALSLAA